MVVRARIVLAAAEGHTNAAIAADQGMHVDTVRKWRRRFHEHGIEGLADLRRSGRPVGFTAAQVAEVKALACTPPTETGVPLARWSTAELATEAVRQGLVETISASTVGRWLASDAIKPWQHRSWIFPRAPDFATKAARVLDLYERRWQGVELGEDEYVISADEKSQLQALRRRHRGLSAAPGRTRRVFESLRHRQRKQPLTCRNTSQGVFAFDVMPDTCQMDLRGAALVSGSLTQRRPISMARARCCSSAGLSTRASTTLRHTSSRARLLRQSRGRAPHRHHLGTAARHAVDLLRERHSGGIVSDFLRMKRATWRELDSAHPAAAGVPKTQAPRREHSPKSR